MLIYEYYFPFLFCFRGNKLFSHHCANTYSLSASLTAHIVSVDGSDIKYRTARFQWKTINLDKLKNDKDNGLRLIL